MATTTTHIALQKNVEQLKRELKVERIKISQACAELQAYCEQKGESDYLLTKQLPPGQTNPYKDKKSMPCTLL